MTTKSNGSTVVRQQPTDNVWKYDHDWSRGLFGCCANCKRCCCATFCTLCYMCSLFERSGECICQGCVPCALMALRSKIRTAFRIKGSLCADCCATTFCCCCAAIQIDAELDEQEIDEDNPKAKHSNRNNRNSFDNGPTDNRSRTDDRDRFNNNNNNNRNDRNDSDRYGRNDNRNDNDRYGRNDNDRYGRNDNDQYGRNDYPNNDRYRR